MVSAVARCAWKPTLSSFVAKRSILFYQADGPICWMCQVKSRNVRHSIWGCNNRIYEFMHEIYTTLKWKIYARKIINYIICRIKLICGKSQVFATVGVYEEANDNAIVVCSVLGMLDATMCSKVLWKINDDLMNDGKGEIRFQLECFISIIL